MAKDIHCVMQSHGRPRTAEETLTALLDAYGDRYRIRRDLSVAGVTPRATASFKHAERRSLLGMRAEGLPMGVSEAGEFVFFFVQDVFDAGSLAETDTLFRGAGQALLDIHKDHSYTMLSAVFLVERADGAALGRLRRYRFRETYAFGWGMGRVAVIETPGPTLHSNGDGKDLRRLLAAHLHGTHCGDPEREDL